jgi:hypothetical protein
MRLYKLKDNDVAPHFSLQKITRIELAAVRFVPIYRSGEQVGRFDRQSGNLIWNMGVQFTEDCEYACLFEPGQGE